MSKKRLGRALSDMGVEALLSGEDTALINGQIQNLPLDSITPNVNQPRKTFLKETLAELAESIAEHGVIQPIVVTEKQPNQFAIIAGERRFRAAKMAGMLEIPAVVKDLDDLASESLAIIENVQREDLNPLDQAFAYTRLVDIYKLSHEEIAKKVKKSRPYISNILRLIKLHPEVKIYLKEGKIEMGHARALLAADYEKQPILARHIIENKFTVRQTEQLLKEKPKVPKIRSTHWISEQLKSLPVKSSVRGSKNKGLITLRYESSQDLEKILTILTTSEEIS